MKMLRAAYVAVLVALGCGAAHAQVGGGSAVYQNWFPQANSPSVAITTSSSAHLYPGLGPTARICNSGNVDAYVQPFGTANTVVATTNSFWLKASTCQAYNLKPSTTQYTYFAAITAAGSTTMYVETGLGAPSSQANLTVPGGGAILGSSLALTNPSSTVPAIVVTQNGNLVGQAIGLLFDPSANPNAGAFKFGCNNYGAFGFSNGPTGQVNYVDDVFTCGMNTASPGNRINTSLPAQYLQWESHFYQSGCFGQEFHLIMVTSTGTQQRPITERVCDDGSNMAIVFSGNGGFHFTDTANSVDTLFVNTSNKSLDFGASSNGIRNPTNNTCDIQQFNAGGTAFICLPYLNASNHFVFNVPIDNLLGPLPIQCGPETGDAACISINVTGSTSTQAIGAIYAGDASTYLKNVLSNTRSAGGNAINNLIAANGNSYEWYMDGANSWTSGIRHADSDAYALCASATFGTNCALRADIASLILSGAFGTIPQTLFVGNTGSTNNSSSGSGAFVAMTPNYTLPANFQTSARGLDLVVAFRYTTGSAVPGFHWELREGSTTLCHFDPSAPTVSLTNHTMAYHLLLQATGAPSGSTAVECAAVGTPNNSNSAASSNVTAQPVNVATNASQVLQIVTEWDTAGTGTNAVQLTQFKVTANN